MSAKHPVRTDDMAHDVTPATCRNRQTLQDIFFAALAAVDPYHAVRKALSLRDNQLQAGGVTYDLGGFKRILVVGAGKAAAHMARAIESLLGGQIDTGLIIVKQGHTAPLSRLAQIEAAHPVPDAAGLAGTNRIMQMVRCADENTLVICLLSGGASSLLVAPVDGVTLADKQQTTQLLLNAGASITELNAVRKHLSQVKGGQLAKAAHPAQLVTLVISDVIGDPLEVIASGPTSADSSTFADAWAVIAKFKLDDKLPTNVAEYLKSGAAGGQPETVKAHDPCMNKTCNLIVASLAEALAAAQQRAIQLGFDTRIVSATLQGEVRDAARLLAQVARAELAQMKPGERRCLIWGGETTVTVHGGGLGGRNQELALAFSLEIDGLRGITLLSAGTDGTDGPDGPDGHGEDTTHDNETRRARSPHPNPLPEVEGTNESLRELHVNDAAGARVEGGTAAQARSLGLDPAGFLENNDSYTFFRAFDAVSDTQHHFKTGPTGTNVMDIQIVLLGQQEV
jgi:glycerate 2-kinase